MVTEQDKREAAEGIARTLALHLLGVTDIDARYDIARDQLLSLRNNLIRGGTDEDAANRIPEAIYDRAEAIEAMGRPTPVRERIAGLADHMQQAAERIADLMQ